MDDARKPFANPVRIIVAGDEVIISDTEQARALLSSPDWPGQRGDEHERALDACLKVLDGHRSTVDAETAFAEAVRAAGLMR